MRGANEAMAGTLETASGRTWSPVVWRLAGEHPLGAAGALLILVTVVTAIFAPVLAPQDPLRIFAERRLSPPGGDFLLGTDNLGRDLLSRIIYGARVSVTIGVLSMLLGSTAGAVVGLVSGYLGGHVDMLVQRLVDTLMAFPLLILAVAVVAILGPAPEHVVIAIALVLVSQAARVVRSATLSVKAAQYVEAARAVGCDSSRILFVHVLPQCVAPFIIVATAAIGWAIVVEASLSFLGVGTPPPTPTWGGMLSGAARVYAREAPWMVIFPGVAISLVVFGFSLLGDAMRDILDPRMRK